MRWGIRFAGLISTVILARILTPEDFGIVAMATLVIGLFDICLDMGAWQLLLRMQHSDRQAYDTAWTIMLIQSAILAFAVFWLAYPAAVYFKEPRLVDVMQVIAIGSALAGLNNIGLVMFRRDLDFRSDFIFGVTSKVVTVVPTVILALIYRNYWAIVVGTIIGHAGTAIVSYVMHPFRPRFSLAGWRRFVSFSLWITPANIANFFNRKADVFAVGYLATTAQMGAYNVAAELSRMATAEIVQPMARAIFPNYAKLINDLPELTRSFLLVLRTVSIVAFSFGFGIAAVAEDIVYVILGDQWGFAVPLILWLGIFGMFTALLSTITGHILIVLHKERAAFVISWVRLLVLGTSVLTAASIGGVVDIAMAAALSTGVFTIASIFYLPSVLPVSGMKILAEVVKIFVIGLTMYFVVTTLHLSGVGSHFVTLLVDVAVGVCVFGTMLYGIWFAAGRPDGIESRLWSFCTNRWKRSLRGRV